MIKVFEKIIGFIHSEIERTESFAEHDTQINIEFFVKQLMEEYNNGWILVSDRLPSEEECVSNRAEFWITDKEGNTYQATFSRIKEDWFDSHDGSFLDVIAWQPLPLAYKPKGE